MTPLLRRAPLAPLGHPTVRWRSPMPTARRASPGMTLVELMVRRDHGHLAAVAYTGFSSFTSAGAARRRLRDAATIASRGTPTAASSPPSARGAPAARRPPPLGVGSGLAASLPADRRLHRHPLRSGTSSASAPPRRHHYATLSSRARPPPRRPARPATRARPTRTSGTSPRPTATSTATRPSRRSASSPATQPPHHHQRDRVTAAAPAIAAPSRPSLPLAAAAPPRAPTPRAAAPNRRFDAARRTLDDAPASRRPSSPAPSPLATWRDDRRPLGQRHHLLRRYASSRTCPPASIARYTDTMIALDPDFRRSWVGRAVATLSAPSPPPAPTSSSPATSLRRGVQRFPADPELHLQYGFNRAFDGVCPRPAPPPSGAPRAGSAASTCASPPPRPTARLAPAHRGLLRAAGRERDAILVLTDGLLHTADPPAVGLIEARLLELLRDREGAALHRGARRRARRAAYPWMSP